MITWGMEMILVVGGEIRFYDYWTARCAGDNWCAAGKSGETTTTEQAGKTRVERKERPLYPPSPCRSLGAFEYINAFRLEGGEGGNRQRQR